MKPWLRDIIVLSVSLLSAVLGCLSNSTIMALVLKQLDLGPLRAISELVTSYSSIAAAGGCAYLSARWARSFLCRNS